MGPQRDSGDDDSDDERDHAGRPQSPTAADPHLRGMWCRRQGRLRGWRRGDAGRRYPLDRRDKPVPAPGQRLHKTGRLGGVAERGAEFANSVIQPLVKVDEGVVAPQGALKVIARDQLSGLGQQDPQELESLWPQRNHAPLPGELGQIFVELEQTKTTASADARHARGILQQSPSPVRVSLATTVACGFT